MAEFALGLTKTAVEGTLSLVKSAVEEEEKLREAVQNDLVFITGEFEVMRSFLRIANREHTANDEVALTLVRQLRTLAFDVEDCVEFVIHLDKSSRWGWLQRLWQTVNCRAPPLPLDVAVAEIKQLKARVEDVSQRNTRYNHILHGSDNNNKQQPVTVMPPPAAEQLYAASATTTTYDPSSAIMFHILRDAWKATGKWSSNMCNLQQELLISHEGEGDHDLRVISVWGSSGTGGGGGAGAPGLGTASIFNQAYCDPEICENFKTRAWVKLTHPFNQDEFVKSLLAQFYQSSSHQAEVLTQDNLNLMKAKLMQQMREQRYLLVLEEVLTVAEWHMIRAYLPGSKNGSRILLSTPQLGIALLCTGEPYQVSDLRNFSGDDKFLCAFSRKEKTARDIGEFVHQLLRGHGVISVWGADDHDKPSLVDILYKGIINGWLEEEIGGFADKSDHVHMLYEGIRNRRRKFERWQSSWVDVPDPFDLKVFAQRLFLNFHSDDIRAEEITKVGMKGEAGLIEWCRKFLSEEKDHHYVVVIYGLQSEGDWDLIQSRFFSSKTATGKGCILVITNKETVATHCVKDRTHLAFNAEDLKADPLISALINKGCWQYAIRGKKGRLFYDRKKDAREWANKFKEIERSIKKDEGEDEEEEEGFNVYVVQGGEKEVCWVRNGRGPVKVISEVEGENSEKGALRHAYYTALFQPQNEIGYRCSWVDLPRVLNDPRERAAAAVDLTDFSWRLLLDFYSDDPLAKEAIAVGLMEGTIIDPIQKCREILRNEKCFVFINRLGRERNEDDWRLIKNTFFSEQHIQSTIFVGSAIRDIFDATTMVWGLETQQQDLIDKKYRRMFSTRKRYQEAIRWLETYQPVGRHTEVDDIRYAIRWMETYQPVGRHTEVDDIRCEARFANLIPVWGISGVGKSNLVRTVYYQEILYSVGLESSYGLGPTQAFAWVDLPSPFNLTDFAWRLLLDFYSDDPRAKESATVSMVEEGCQVPILECRKILRTGNCLVVMDGLRSKQDWDLIKATFLAMPIEGTIVVITHEEEVAMHCLEHHKGRHAVQNIRRLEANAAFSLFEKKAREGNELTPEEKGLSKSVVDKCGGLPKVIAAIGEKIVSERGFPGSLWLEVLNDNFMGTLEMFHGLRPLLSWMQSYFDACSDSIKPCVFYLSIFDAEKDIRLRRLLWRWIAEGYCRDTSDGTTCEENGKKFVSELVKLSIIQESASSKVFCQINGFFHEYIISRPMEDNLVFALEGRCSLNSQRAGQHLTIRSSWDRNEIVYESIDFSRLRSLTVFGKWESFFISSKKVNMRLLRVLDLEDATDITNEDLDKIAKLLTRLKFLSLRGHTEINCLPVSMGGLRQLQTLDIRGTFIATLPPFITKLHKLRYIRAGTTTEVWDWEGDIVPAADGEEDRTSAAAQGGTDSTGPVLPAEAEPGSSVSCNNRSGTLVSSLLSKLCRRRGGGGVDNNNGPAAEGVTVHADIGKLVVLHTLGVVKVSAQCGNKAIFQDLKKLTQLRKLGVSGINKGNIHEFCEAISGHAHLTSLSVEVDKDVGNLDDNIPEPPKTIKRLKLYGRVHKLLPVWRKHLHNLEKLHLTIEKLEESPGLLELSPKFPMDHLRIRPTQDGELQINILWWNLARIVEVQCSSVLHIKFGFELGDEYIWIFHNVEVLKVHFSEGSQSSLKISGLKNLKCLKEVWLKGYTEAHKQDMQRQIDSIELETRPVLKLVRPRSS